MKHLLIAACLPFALIACASNDGVEAGDQPEHVEAEEPRSPEEQLLGSWGISEETIHGMLQIGPDTPEETKAQMAPAIEMMKAFSITFAADGTVTTIDAEGESSGTFTLANVEGQSFSIVTVIDGETKEVDATIDGDTLSAVVDGQAIEFARQ